MEADEQLRLAKPIGINVLVGGRRLPAETHVQGNEEEIVQELSGVVQAVAKFMEEEAEPLEDLEEAATKASSADEAKSSANSDDGIEANDESGDEVCKCETEGSQNEKCTPAYYYIGDVNSQVDALKFQVDEDELTDDLIPQSASPLKAQTAYIGDVNCKVLEEIASSDKNGNGRTAWQTQPKPTLAHRAKAIIYELGFDDFTLDTEVLDDSMHKAYTPAPGCFDLRQLAAAGITHVHVGQGTSGDSMSDMVNHQRLTAAMNAIGLRVVVDAPVPCTDVSQNQSSKVEEVVSDSFVQWAVDHRVDGFCFDASRLTARCVQQCRAALNALTLETHGVDGPRILLYSKAASFLETDCSWVGEPSEPIRCQLLSSTGVSFCSSRICDEFDTLLRTCWHCDNPSDGALVKSRSAICTSLATSAVHLAAANPSKVSCSSDGFGPEAIGFPHSPDEVINVALIGNDAEYPSGCSKDDQFRIIWLRVAAAMVAHGTPLLGLQRQWSEMASLHAKELSGPLVFERLIELVRIRVSTPLLSLTDPLDLTEKVRFPSIPKLGGVIMMQVQNGPPARFQFVPPLCKSFAQVVVVVSMQRMSVRVPAPSATSHFEVHPMQVASIDEATRRAFFDVSANELVVPPLSAVVFVEPLAKSDMLSGQ
jgi:hypothetical protein